MRSTLGDAIVELSLKPLRSLLETFSRRRPFLAERGRTEGAGIARAARELYPKQLAEKLRSTGSIQGERRHATVVFADFLDSRLSRNASIPKWSRPS